MDKKSGNANVMAFFNILGPIILNGISFFTIPIFTRILGTADYGLFTIYNTWVSTFAILVSLQVAATTGVANVRLPENKIKAYYSSVLTIALISFVIWFVIICVGMPFFVRYLGLSQPMIYLMLFHSLGMAFVNFAITRYTYEKKAYYTFAISVLVAVVGIVLSLIFLYNEVWEEHLYYGRAYGAAIPYLLLGTLVCIVFYTQGKKLISLSNWKFCLLLSLPMVFHSLSQLLLAQADKVMLKNLMTDSDVGIYSFTYSFAHVMNIIYNALNNTWVPFYYDDVKEGKIEQIHRKSKNYIFLFTALSLGFILLAPDVIKLFAGEDYWGGISLVPIFVLANYMMFLYSFPVNYEFYHKKSIHIAIGTGAAAIINCALNYLFIPRFGMAGASYATLISYLLLWIFHHMVSSYIIKKNYHYKIKQFVPGIMLMTLGSVFVYFFEHNMIIRWFAAIVVGVIALRRIIKTKSIF